MKKVMLAAIFVAAAAAITGCVDTVSDTHTMGVPLARDSVEGRYPRTLDQVYRASIAVVNANGVLVREYIPHDTTNVVRSLEAKVNEEKVWIRTEAIEPRVTAVTVQARSTFGTDLDLAHELEKEIALQLAR